MRDRSGASVAKRYIVAAASSGDVLKPRIARRCARRAVIYHGSGSSGTPKNECMKKAAPLKKSGTAKKTNYLAIISFSAKGFLLPSGRKYRAMADREQWRIAKMYFCVWEKFHEI